MDKLAVGKLWDKGGYLDRTVERFTVGEDRGYDMRLLKADVVASIAHADMLAAIGVLEVAELTVLREALSEAIKEINAGQFRIGDDEEDGHTALERFLTERTGNAGKRIHTGRSRNDQVIAAMRLYAREWLLNFRTEIIELADDLLDFAEAWSETPMPGRTHMQPAMPSTVGLWAAAFAEELIDDVDLVECAYRRNNKSPLGAAAGYGVPLPLDREMVAKTLGFAGVQNNVLYVNNSRGVVEAQVAESAGRVCGTLAQLSQDLMIFTLPEFGYFRLPEELTTGSSIMPQKRNPDLLELIRAKAALVDGQAAIIRSIILNLPSGYNRDMQQTKGPFLISLKESADIVSVMRVTISRLSVDERRLEAGCNLELLSADRAYKLVSEGVPFRDAYRQVGAELSGDFIEPQPAHTDVLSAALAKDYKGAPGNLSIDISRQAVEELRGSVASDRAVVTEALTKLAGPLGIDLTQQPAESSLDRSANATERR
uniref:Argininosuccinate lyase n=1 Tax=uncultured Spirochaetales bacterium HF0500_06B09 TaxID=710994 RepID=E0XY84_9SPIR|nr:argininosuccinate lyase [uncultured Spirochaetales bacterium HF0500_06B09]